MQKKERIMNLSMIRVGLMCTGWWLNLLGWGAAVWGEVVARDDFDNPLRRLEFQQTPAANALTSPDDAFRIYQVDVGTVPRALVDTSPTSTDTLGVINPATKRDRWFGISDLRNPDNPTGTGRVTWQFDVAGFTALSWSVDVVAMGDFEEEDEYHWAYSWDGIAYTNLLRSRVDLGASHNYLLLDGTGQLLDDPLKYGEQLVSNIWTTLRAPLSGTGTRLWVQLQTVADGGTEVVAFDNLVIEGTRGVVTQLLCDLNQDSGVDASDMGVVFASWGGTGLADFSADGIVDAADASVCFAEWTGDPIPGVGLARHTVPEPSCLGYLLSLSWLVGKRHFLRR